MDAFRPRLEKKNAGSISSRVLYILRKHRSKNTRQIYEGNIWQLKKRIPAAVLRLPPDQAAVPPAAKLPPKAREPLPEQEGQKLSPLPPEAGWCGTLYLS
jgi:hypothetical protein